MYEYVDDLPPNQVAGNPQRPQQYFENERINENSQVDNDANVELDTVNRPTDPNARPNSFNQPIVLKQSNLLTSVPASELAGAQFAQQITTTATTTSTTTTTEAPTERSKSNFRSRGQNRIRGGIPHHEAPEEQKITHARQFHDASTR